MKPRSVIRSLTPGFGLRLFRVIRNHLRQSMQPLSNQYHAYKYLRQIRNRIPLATRRNISGTVLDLGANVGHFTHAVRKLGFSCVAVEPHPAALVHLLKRFKSDTNVNVIEAAVSNNIGKITLNFHPDHMNDQIQTSISASIIEDKFGTQHETYQVNTIPLSEFFSNPETYTIVKIDIEGAEMFLIEELIINASKIEYLLMERHERFMKLTKYANEYEKKLVELDKFIAQTGRTQKWYTNWL